MDRFSRSLAAFSALFVSHAFAQNSSAPVNPSAVQIAPSDPLPPVPRQLRDTFCVAGNNSVFAPEEAAILHCHTDRLEKLSVARGICPAIDDRIDYEELMIELSVQDDDDKVRRSTLVESLRHGRSLLCLQMS